MPKRLYLILGLFAVLLVAPLPLDAQRIALTKQDIGTAAGTVAAGNDSRFPEFTPEMYGALGDATADDTAAIQAAITAAQTAHGKVKLGQKTYRITAPLTISDACAVEGVGCQSLWGPRSTLTSDIHLTVAPYLVGSVILQTSANTDAIRITATGRSVPLRNFGIRFADAIKFNSTGHGIYALPPTYLTYRDNGLDNCEWANLSVYGHDGNHYAFYLVNAQLMSVSNIQGWGGGLLKWETNTLVNFYGNSVVSGAYCMLLAGGSAHGYHLATTQAGHGTILMHFVRPQTFADNTISGPTAHPTSAQNSFRADDDTQWLTITAPNFEGPAGCAMRFPDNLPGSFIGSGFCLSSYSQAATPAWSTSGYVAGKMFAASKATPPAGMAGVEANGTAHGGYYTIYLNDVLAAGLQAYDGNTFLNFGGTLTFADTSLSNVQRATLGQDGHFTTIGDLESSDSTKGVVLKSPNGTRWRMTVSDAGAPVFTSL